MTSKFKLIDANEARAELTKHVERTKRQLAAVTQVIDSLRGLEGTKLTNHLSNKLKKQFPSLSFYISTVHSWYELDIEGEGFDSISLNLVYKSEPGVVNIKRIEELNQRYILDSQRIPVYEHELADIEGRVKRYNDALRELAAAHKNLGTGSFSITDNDTPRVEDFNGRWLDT